MLGTQLKENHLLFIISFVFTQDHSREYAGSTVSLRNCNSLKTELKKQTFFSPASLAPVLCIHNTY